MEFAKRKSMALSALAREGMDKSPKGSLDVPIIPLLDAINAHPSYFTTSSCSGRISILSHAAPNDQSSHKNKKKKKAGDWVFITHEFADPETVSSLLFNPPSSSDDSHDTMVFRFEPFILAVDCIDVTSAHSLVAMAISCGFRESGISSVSKRIMVAIRCSIRLEVPLGEMGRMMVSPEYVRYLVGIANEKMAANRKRTDAFLGLFTASKGPADVSPLGNDDKQTECMEEGNVLDLEARQLKSLSSAAAAEQDAPYIVVSKVYTMKRVTLTTTMTTKNSNHVSMTGSSSTDRCSVSANKMKILDLPVGKLFRWGHSASLLNDSDSRRILVFGGFGGVGRHSRQNDSLLLDPRTGMLKVLHAVGPPSPRIGHTSSVIGNHMFVIGGRGDPTQIFSDVWVLHTEESRWEILSCTGSVFGPRHRHAAAVVDTKVYVHGGLYHELIYPCVHVLDTETMQWTEIDTKGEQPCARHSHSMVAAGSQLFMFGGYDGETALGDLYSFDTNICLWKKVKTTGRNPSARFSHSMFIYKRYLGIVGGCPVTKQLQGIFLFDLQTHVWKHVETGFVNYPMLVRSTVSIVGDDLVMVGGGASCYAFGTKFNEPMQVDCCLLTSLASDRHADSVAVKPLTNPEETKVGNGTAVAGLKGLTDDENLHYNACAHATNGNPRAFHDQRIAKDTVEMKPKKWALQIQRRYAKLGKDIVKKIGWLDTGRKVYKTEDEQIVFLPVTEKCHTWFLEKVACSDNLVESPKASDSMAFCMAKGFSLDGASLPELQNLLLACGASLVEDDIALMRRQPRSPQKILREAVMSLIHQKGLPTNLLEQLPSRWERLGNIVVLPSLAFNHKIWDSVSAELWPIVASSLGAVRLARQGKVAATGTRDSTLEILVGANGWVDHHENGIFYSFDSTQCMFSWGNLSEKLRMSKLDCRNEIIVDLFAGIGYFVLPFLVKAGAKLVYACEWNPHALNALRKNVAANFVSDRCIILDGDNRIVAPQGVADRVCLGLLPTSEDSWPTAVRALKPQGGVLHVHGNVKDSEEDSWSLYVVQSIQEIAKSEGRQWQVQLEHLERVKWYAPHIRHLVADIKCSLALC
ncbi:tRNA wybutosine-synthesizing protein 2/3/4 [Nymphaea colorata]|nr:tRNA wybutosine-synthesizing protein 2/3/4 [Nymphaea colorata]